MQAPRALARFNKRVSNPIQMAWAPWLPPFAVVEHTGRKSGTVYRTPVSAFAKDDNVGILLPYGDNTDWIRNVLAAGQCTLQRRGRKYTVTDLRVVATDSPELPPTARRLGRPFKHTLAGKLQPL
ncbi:nitroreductase family deazaflavin-dependent oxidoreductase [Mycolicibacter senuensis]|nr:nitroreductase family deazaflavin-dependent oxidoreductase [Mycolicibacter senuensis]RAV03888.1 nitroreductase family deazaflavin-dependent oxidoreductase [Mycolicibacter senuensis]